MEFGEELARIFEKNRERWSILEDFKECGWGSKCYLWLKQMAGMEYDISQRNQRMYKPFLDSSTSTNTLFKITQI